MRIILENFDEKHIRLLKEMANVLNFEVKKTINSSTEKLSDNSITELEEKEMTLFAMQSSEKALAEVWNKEEDEYWNSYL